MCTPSHGKPSLLGVIVQKGRSLKGHFNQGWLAFSSGTGIPPGLCGDVVKVEKRLVISAYWERQVARKQLGHLNSSPS